ncbi:Microtubule-associated protein 70-1, partial [Cucurbita argyrosperma subsp. sororia]
MNEERKTLDRELARVKMSANRVAVVEANEKIHKLLIEKLLPEKGKLLEAVMKAGPLLQTPLVAEPLPEWRHPPLPL